MDDLPGLVYGVWFDQHQRSLLHLRQLSLGERVGIVDNFKQPRVNVNSGAYEEFIELNIGFRPFEENPTVLLVDLLEN